MAFTYGFYNSVGSDRTYDAVQMSKIFDGIINDGVYEKIGDAFAVAATGVDLNVTVMSGRAWFDHTWNLNDSGIQIAIPQGHVSYDRIDSIILEVNETTRINSISRLPGAEEADPEPPILTNTSTVHQYRLANIYVAKQVTVINQEDVTYLVGTGNTPLVSGPLTVVSLDNWLAQWQNEWDNWFEYIMGELDSEVAGNLQNQITAIRGDNNPPAITLLQVLSHNHTGGQGGQVPNAGIANDAVDDLKVGNRVPQLRRRQGGSSSNWSTGADSPSNHTPTTVRKQVGVARITISDTWSAANKLITFPEAFSNVPLPTSLTVISDITASDFEFVYAYSITASNMRIGIKREGTIGTLTMDVAWEVTGPE